MSYNLSITLLELVKEFCKRRGLPIPITVVGSTDPTVLQMWGLLNETVQTLVDRYEWSTRTARYEFNHRNLAGPFAKYVALSVREMGDLPDIRHMLNRTLWDATNHREVNGPLNPKEWEAYLQGSGPRTGTNFQYTIHDGFLCIYPVPDPLSSVLFSFAWISRYTVLTNGLGGEAFYQDDSLCVYPSAILLTELKWRWNQAKGLPYAEDFRQSEEMIVNAMGREGAPDIVLDNEWDYDVRPGILVPSGDWKVS